MYNEHNEEHDSALQHIADELAIKNMMDSLEKHGKFYTMAEVEKIMTAIKRHNLMNAQLVIGKTDGYVRGQNGEFYNFVGNILTNKKL